jgi:hypothetical protein
MLTNFCKGVPDGLFPCEYCNVSVKFTIYDPFQCPRCEHFCETLQSSSTEHSDTVAKSTMPVRKGTTRKGSTAPVVVTQMHPQLRHQLIPLHALVTQKTVSSEPVSVHSLYLLKRVVEWTKISFRQLEALDF